MKVSLTVVGEWVLVWSLVTFGNGFGQEAAQPDFSQINIRLESPDEVQTLLEALTLVDPMPFDTLPRNRRNQVVSVGYWSMQHPNWPPLPGNFYSLPVWPLGDGYFVLDDRNLDYAALPAKLAEAASISYGSSQLRTMMSSLTSDAYGNPIYLTNLVVTAGPMTASFDLAGGTNAVPYDIQVTTNLLSAWNWLGLGYTSNRYTFTNQPNDTAFYRLAKPSKTMTVGWGDNYYYQCDPPLGLTNAIMVTGGGGYTVALLTDGTAIGWGGRTNEGSIPANLTGISMIASGIDHKVALLTNGTVLAWGATLFGQTPVPTSLTNATVISSQYLHTLALRNDGTVVVWGGTFNPSLTNIPAGLTNVVAIAAGCLHNLAVKADGTVAAWGDNGRGQCTVPAGLSNVLDVAAGWAHSVALKRDGTIAVWGNNTLGELNVPAGLSNVVAIAAAGYPSYSGYTIALKKDGAVVTWGKNKAALPLNGLSNVIAIGAEYDSGLAIRTGPPTPVVTLEPVDQFLTAGSTTGFSVQGQGLYGVTYQWQTNGVNFTGATNPALTLTNVQLAQQGNYRALITDNGGYGSIASSNASLTLITPPTFVYQSTPTNIVTIYGKRINFSGTAVAPGTTNGFPISCRWQFNGTNIAGVTTNAFGFTLNDATPGTYTLIASNAAGSASVSWQAGLTNFIDVTQDLLLIYNTNSPDSTFCLNYYLSHRPNVSRANVLGIGYTNPATPWYYETVTPQNLTNQIFNPLLNWLTNNPAKRPQYVILFMDLPGRVSGSSAFNYPAAPISSVCVQLNLLRPDWNPYVTHLNMGMSATATNNQNNTNDFVAYINKLAAIGVPISSNSPVLSASLGGYANTNYVLDNVRFQVPDPSSIERYEASGGVISGTTNALIASGVPLASIQYYDALITNVYFNTNVNYWVSTYQTNGVSVTLTNAFLTYNATNASNLAGYVSWGAHGNIAGRQMVDGSITWHGNSGWWLINTIESWNGLQYTDLAGQSSFEHWFYSTAFGGINYSNTPIGGVSTVYEPGVGGKNDNSAYFGLWTQGKNFGICAWVSKGLTGQQSYFQATGDPLLTR